jgi:hypothetical protein
MRLNRFAELVGFLLAFELEGITSHRSSRQIPGPLQDYEESAFLLRVQGAPPVIEALASSLRIL